MTARERAHHKEQARKTRRLRVRVCFLGLLSLAGLIFLTGQILRISIRYGDEYRSRSVQQFVGRLHRSVARVDEPIRGSILDRNRQPLAETEVVFNVFMDVNLIHSLTPTPRRPDPKGAILEAVYEQLAPVGVTLQGMQSFFDTHPDGSLVHRTHWRLVARHVPAYIALNLTETPHVHLEQASVRRYPDPFFAPQVLGFRRDVEEHAYGLERQYYARLRGQQGQVFRTFHTGTASFVEDIPVRHGYTLVTTLDAGIQRIAQRTVAHAAETFDPEFAGLAIMNPHSGEVLAMAQWPPFSLEDPANPEYFASPQLARQWPYLPEDEQSRLRHRIWTNFFTGRSFEPGSTFKSFVMAAALEEGIVRPDVDVFFCGGSRQVADWNIPCTGRHGQMNITEALMFSCNVAFMDLIRTMGPEIFYRYRNDFGFGERTGIDFPDEEAVSSPLVMYTLPQLRPVELATSSFGQGFNSTALQTLSAYAPLINGGNLMQPFLVSQIVDPRGNVVHENTPTLLRRVISQETSDFMREAMRYVVTPAGTGRRAVIPGYSIGGKTGTGQQGADRDWYVSSFVAYFPVEDPQFLAIAVLYNPAGGSTASTSPMIQEVFEGIIQHLQIPPADTDTAPAPRTRELLPDFSGMPLQEVTRTLNNLDVDYNIVGSGTIVRSHIPPAGQPIPRTNPLILYLDGNVEDAELLTFVPHVAGLDEDRAAELVIAAGLVPVIVPDPGTGEDWIVRSQSPSGGLHIQRGTHVRLRTRVP